MLNPAVGLPRVSAAKVERSLAVLLIALLGMYALGTASGGVAPAPDTVGVIAVHFAVIVAGAFPLVVLGHAVSSQVRTAVVSPRFIEVITAAVALGCLITALWLTLDATSRLTTVLFGCAIGALLVLTGLVAGRE